MALFVVAPIELVILGLGDQQLWRGMGAATGAAQNPIFDLRARQS